MENVTTEKQPSLMATALKYGLIIGLVSITFNMISIALGDNPYVSSWRGFIGAGLTIAVVVWAHKDFKENGDGYMSYGQGLGISIISIFVSTILTLVFSYVYLTYVNTATWDEIWLKAVEDMEAKGQSDAQIEMGVEWGKKLFYIIFPVIGVFFGLIIGLIVSIFTQKKRPEQAF